MCELYNEFKFLKMSSSHYTGLPINRILNCTEKNVGYRSSR